MTWVQFFLLAAVVYIAPHVSTKVAHFVALAFMALAVWAFNNP